MPSKPALFERVTRRASFKVHQFWKMHIRCDETSEQSSKSLGTVGHLTGPADAICAAHVKRAGRCDDLMGCIEGSPEETQRVTSQR